MEHTTATDQAGAGSGARRRRPILASLTTLGLAAGLVGVTGFFAAGSDSATTGTNEAVSGEVDFPDVDLLLSHATYDEETEAFTCVGEFTDDLTTGLLTADGRVVNDGDDPVWWDGFVCVRNAGDTAGSLSVTAIDVVDDETGCSEGEVYVDETCGTGIGELSNDLRVGFTQAVQGTPAPDEHNCFVYAGQNGDPEQELLPSIATMSAGSLDLGRIEAGETIGLCPTGYWNASGDSTPFIDSQTDRTTWRFRFDSTLASDDPSPEPCVDDANEDNDGTTTAVEITEDGVEATACPADDDVWFLAGSDSSADMRTITLDWASDATDLDLVVYDADSGVLLLASDGVSNHEEVTLSAGRDLHIVVVPYSGPRADYELGITVNPAP